jgi:hypothetical protein
MTARCLTEEQLICLYYEEPESLDHKEHLAGCSLCQEKFHQLCNDLMEIEMEVPDGGFTAVNEAVKIVEKPVATDAGDEILTPDEVADWFKVSRQNIMNMVHLLPHFVIDGKIRFERSALKSFLQKQGRGAESKAPDQPQFKIISLVSRKAG